MHLLQMLTLTSIFTNICKWWWKSNYRERKKVSLAEDEIGFILTTQSQQLVLRRQLDNEHGDNELYYVTVSLAFQLCSSLSPTQRHVWLLNTLIWRPN